MFVPTLLDPYICMYEVAIKLGLSLFSLLSHNPLNIYSNMQIERE